MSYRAGDTVVRKDGYPGAWVVTSVAPTGQVFFRGYRGPFTADLYEKQEPQIGHSQTL